MLSSPLSIIFFAIFAIVLVVTYIAIRREWLSKGIIIGLSMVGSVITMLMVSLSQGNTVFQALVVSVMMGIIFSLITVAIAIFFHSNEVRQQRMQGKMQTVGDSE